MRIRILPATAAVVASVAVLGFATPAQAVTPACGALKVVAHRGDHSRYIENTMRAFHDGTVNGADVIEADLRPTRDGRIVLMHDETLNRTTTGTGYVSRRSSERYKTVIRTDDGQRVPFVGRFLGLLVRHPGQQAFLDLKAGMTDAPVLARLRRALAARDVGPQVTFTSSHPAALRAVGKAIPGARRLLITWGTIRHPDVVAGYAGAVAAPLERLTPAYMAALSAAGLRVQVMASGDGIVDDPANWDTAASLGAWSVSTNDLAQFTSICRTAA